MKEGNYMKKFYCPICGNTLQEEFSHGDICGCCGNQSGFDDFQLFECAKLEKELNANLLDEIRKYVPKSNMEKLRNIKKFTGLQECEYYDILRYIWVNNGCIWWNNSYNEKPSDWNIYSAEKQLLNLNLNLKDYLTI